jgi:hypothetical protein
MSNIALGIAAGALWNLASLWCLARLLKAWLGPTPSTRRVVGWLLVKFPLLYTLIVLLFQVPSLSLAGFGVGFSLVLIAAGALMCRGAARSIPSPHVR